MHCTLFAFGINFISTHNFTHFTSKLPTEMFQKCSIKRSICDRLPPGVISQVQLTLRYSSQRQRLVVVIHKAK
jgi:hypothetical protein